MREDGSCFLRSQAHVHQDHEEGEEDEVDRGSDGGSVVVISAYVGSRESGLRAYTSVAGGASEEFMVVPAGY